MSAQDIANSVQATAPDWGVFNFDTSFGIGTLAPTTSCCLSCFRTVNNCVCGSLESHLRAIQSPIVTSFLEKLTPRSAIKFDSPTVASPLKEPLFPYLHRTQHSLELKPWKFAEVMKEDVVEDQTLEKTEQEEPKKKAKRQSKVSSEPATTVNRTSKRWVQHEDVILCGLVMETYYRRHSLKPSQAEKQQADAKEESSESLVWSKIHEQYVTCCRRFTEITGRDCQGRSVRAIQKRWKISGKQADHVTPGGKKIPITKFHQQLWDFVYNEDNILTSSPAEYAELLQDKDRLIKYKSSAIGSEELEQKPKKRRRC